MSVTKHINIVEALWTGEKHTGFNAAFLKVLENVFESEKLSFYGEKQHVVCVQQKMGAFSRRVNLNCIAGINITTKFKIPFAYLLSLLQSIRFLFKTSKKDLLIYTSLAPFALIPIKLLNGILKRRIIIVLHGELASLNGSTKKLLNAHYRFIGSVFTASFKRTLNADNIYYLVLGKPIIETLASYLDSKTIHRRIISIEHPYIFANVAAYSVKSDKEQYLNLGIVGLATRSKGAHKIVQLYQLLKTRADDFNVRFNIVGKVADFQEEIKGTDILYNDTKHFIDQSTYDKTISILDYVLFFYPDDIYSLTASGAFMDAILHDKPIIAIKNSYFEYYFNYIGPIGYLCEDLEEMASVIARIANNGDNMLPLFKKNVSILKEQFGVNSVAVELRKGLSNKMPELFQRNGI